MVETQDRPGQRIALLTTGPASQSLIDAIEAQGYELASVSEYLGHRTYNFDKKREGEE